MKKMVKKTRKPPVRNDRMTKTAYMAMTRELAKRAERDMIKAAEELWQSGAIDPDSYQRDSYMIHTFSQKCSCVPMRTG